MKLISYTFTFEELKADLKKLLVQAAGDVLEDAANGDKACLKLLYVIQEFSNYNDESIIKLWTEYCSIIYLDQNPDISDVLVLYSHEENDIPIKEWIASRP